MPCYTRVRIIRIDDDLVTQKAVANLGFRYEEQQSGCRVGKRNVVGWREKGYATALEAAQAIKREAGVLRTIAETRRLQPDAIIRRKGADKLTVTVMV